MQDSRVRQRLGVGRECWFPHSTLIPTAAATQVEISTANLTISAEWQSGVSLKAAPLTTKSLKRDWSSCHRCPPTDSSNQWTPVITHRCAATSKPSASFSMVKPAFIIRNITRSGTGHVKVAIEQYCGHYYGNLANLGCNDLYIYIYIYIYI